MRTTLRLMRTHTALYLMILPVLAYFAVFVYYPLYEGGARQLPGIQAARRAARSSVGELPDRLERCSLLAGAPQTR